MDGDADPGGARRRPVHRRGLYYDKIVKNHLSLNTLEEHLPEIDAKRLVLTHMSDDMLGRLDSLPHIAANDGMIVEL